MVAAVFMTRSLKSRPSRAQPRNCPRRTLESGLRETVDWYLANEAWVTAVGQQRDFQSWIERNYAARGALS